MIKTTEFKQRRIINASPQEVYDAFVSGRKHSEFTGARATSLQRVGGKFTAWDGYVTGKYLVLQKGKRIAQEWKTTEWPRGYAPSHVELILNEHPKGTEVLLTHSNVPAHQAAQYRKGWIERYWERLSKYFSEQPR